MKKELRKNKIEIVNLIEIDGKPEVPFDSISDEEKRRVAIIMNERIMKPIGYRIKSSR